MTALNLTSVPTSGRHGRTPLANIDPVLAETIEEAFVFCSGSTDRLQTPAFASKDDAEDWLSDARAYAYQRPAGRVVVAGNPIQAAILDADGKATGKTGYAVRFRVEPFTAPVSD